MDNLSNLPFNVDKTLEFFLQPTVEADMFMGGLPGTRIIAPQLGVNNGDNIAKYTIPNALIQKKPTEAQFKAGSPTSFGGTTVGLQTWDLSDHWIFDQLSVELFHSGIGITTKDIQNEPDAAGRAIFDFIVNKYGRPLVMDMYRHSFWSILNGHDFLTDYPSTGFEAQTEESLELNTGYVKMIKDAITAGTIINTDVSATGSNQNGTSLDGAAAHALIEQLISQSGYLIRNYNRAMPSPYRSKIVISDQWYYAFESYILDKQFGTDNGLMIFGQTPTGELDMNKPIGVRYRGYEVYNGYALFDDYWVTHSVAYADKQIMGMMVAPDNLTVGLNLQSPIQNDNTGLRIYQNPLAKYGHNYELEAYVKQDFLIKDPSLISTVGFEK